MKEMLINYRGHNLSKGNIIKSFYHGLNEITQEVLIDAVGGIFLYKTPNQAYQLLEDKVLLKLNWDKNQKTKSSLKKTVAFTDEGNSNFDTDKIMARMDAMTIKMHAQYKELQSRAKQPTPDLDDGDIPMSHKEEAKFMQTFLGAVLGQKDGKNFHPIYFASKTLNLAQQKYTVTEKELMAIVFAFDKFRSYLIISKTIVHTDHSALKHLFKKQDAKPRFNRWILLLQEFEIEIKDKKGIENVVADHLSRIDNNESSDDSEVDDNFLGETLMEINTKDEPWFVDFANYLVGDIIAKGMTYQQKNKFFSDLKHYFWEEPYLFKYVMTSPQKNFEKTVKDNPTIWSRNLDDALWAFRTAYKTPTGTTPYKLIYGKNYHLPFEIEHHAYWALKNYNPDLIVAGEKRMFQLHKLDELRHQAYENSRLYKARTKVWHDKKLRMRKEFKHGNKVSCFKEELYLSSFIFESCDDLLKSVRAFYYAKGYGLSIHDSQKDKYVTLQCQRSGSYRDVRNIGDKRKRSTTSRLVECPFQIGGKKGSDSSWVFKVANLEYNHEPSTDMPGYPSFRRLEPDEVQSVKSMTVSGTPPRQILTSLRQQIPNLPANSRTIYNLKAKIRRDELGDRSNVRALLDELEKGGFTYDDFKHSDGHITRFFIAHPLSIKLARLVSDVFVMDCTYKTNKYKMPLLDIIGVSSFNTSFYYGFSFLKNEDEDSYEWELNAFKKILGDNNQPSVIITDRELALMNGIKRRLRYIYVNLESEGAHAKLKKYLQVSTGDFQQVKKKLCLAIEHEFNEIKVRLARDSEAEKQYVKAKDGNMCNYYGFTFFYGFKHHFTMGLPCAHKIKHMKGNVLTLDLVHSHWRIDTLSLIQEDDSHDDDANKFVTLLDELCSNYQVWPLHKKEITISIITKLVNEQDRLFEPVIQRPRERPPKAKKKRGTTSTTRDPSRFEYVESSNKQNPSSSNHEDNQIDLNAYPDY
nr:protein FAR1-related sequence 5 [Tanacetum cinerariifolium]